MARTIRGSAAPRPAVLVASGRTVWSVSFAKAAPGVHAAIDAAYHAKYDRYGPRIVGSVVGPDAEAVTIRLVPR
jgi:hypothetical protein